MDESKRRALAAWLRKAEHDLRSAKRLHTDDPPLLDTAAYHCQQAAEKALKCFLTLHDVQFRKTHLLLPLLADCVEIDSQFDSLAENCATLTPFATEFRYPGAEPDPAEGDVAEAIRLAQAVLDFVGQRLPA